MAKHKRDPWNPFDVFDGLVDDLGETFEDISDSFSGELEWVELSEIFEPKSKVAPRSKEQIKLDKQALLEFTQNFHWAADLTDKQAQENLESGVVEIIYPSGKHSSNGLLVTKNGYMVTSYHCVDNLPNEELFVQTNKGTKHKLIKVVRAIPSRDIALVLIDMDGPTEAKKYRFAPKFDLAKKFPVVHLSRRNKDLKRVFGTVMSPRLVTVTTDSGHIHKQQILVHLRSRNGDSGGVVASVGSAVYGLAASGGEAIVDRLFCTFWFEVIIMINDVVNAKKK